MPRIKVKGMSCQHCVNAVTEAMQGLGAKDVQVDLPTGNVTYAEDAPIATAAIKAAIEKIGFEFAG